MIDPEIVNTALMAAESIIPDTHRAILVVVPIVPEDTGCQMTSGLHPDQVHPLLQGMLDGQRDWTRT